MPTRMNGVEAGTTTRAKIVASLAPSTLAAFMGIDDTEDLRHLPGRVPRVNPSRVADAAVPGVVRLEWTGPQGNRRYVKRRNPVYLRHGLGRWADAVPLSWDTGRAAPAARETDAPAKQ